MKRFCRILQFFHSSGGPHHTSAVKFYSTTSSLISQTGNFNEQGRHQRQGKRWRGFASASVAAGLVFVGFSKYKSVSAAKPIYDYGGGGVGGDGRGGGAGGVPDDYKKSNREKYNFIAEVVESVGDTVVSIEVKDHSRVDFFTGVPHTASNGSGFIVSEDGLILTNAHVVASRPRSSVSVKLSDGRTFLGVIEDIDLEADLATVRINAKNLPILPLGCSSETKMGEWVVAVGAPLNFTNTITAGIVSSVNRGAGELGIYANDINYIQTDAAITFGNSGGPLINLDGEAIGINSMKVTAGISFAIPIDYAKKFLANSAARKSSGKKHPTRSYLGLTILTVNEQIRRELESRGYKKVQQGVLVWQVVVPSPAYLAGIKPGDIIVRINGTDITSATDLYEIAQIADKLVLHVQRGDKLYSCTLNPEQVTEE